MLLTPNEGRMCRWGGSPIVPSLDTPLLGSETRNIVLTITMVTGPQLCSVVFAAAYPFLDVAYKLLDFLDNCNVIRLPLLSEQWKLYRWKTYSLRNLVPWKSDTIGNLLPLEISYHWKSHKIGNITLLKCHTI